MITGCTCGTESYHSFWEDKTLMRCWKCGAIEKMRGIISTEPVIKEYLPVAMPSQYCLLTRRLWKQINPWPLLEFYEAKKFGFYPAMINNAFYIVMPILRKDKPVSYTARLVGERQDRPKHVIPKRSKKEYWLSNDELRSKEGRIFISESIPDAAHLSQLGASVALLGIYYDGSLNHLFKGKDIVVALDSDGPGIANSWHVSIACNGYRNLHFLRDSDDRDPKNIPLSELKKILKGKEFEKESVAIHVRV